MKKIDLPLVFEGKGNKNKQSTRGKMFGYQVLGFGAGGTGSPFVEASGGTETLSGDYKIHTFASPGTFSVTNGGDGDTANLVDYFVVAGGGGGGNNGYPQQRAGGAGGGGGFRLSNVTGQVAAPVMSPLAATSGPLGGLAVTKQDYSITVGAGGAGGQPATNSGQFSGYRGADSIFSSITSTGGGGGSGHPLISGGPSPVPAGPQTGGSGSGGNSVFDGNTPPTTPPQGNPGGPGLANPPSTFSCGGGGGAGAPGGAVSGTTGGAGGIGSFVADAVGSATPTAYGTPGPVSNTRYFSGGGGGISGGGASPAGGGTAFGASSALPNTGGGGGGENFNSGGAPTGGSGIVILRYKYQ